MHRTMCVDTLTPHLDGAVYITLDVLLLLSIIPYKGERGDILLLLLLVCGDTRDVVDQEVGDVGDVGDLTR